MVMETPAARAAQQMMTRLSRQRKSGIAKVCWSAWESKLNKQTRIKDIRINHFSPLASKWSFHRICFISAPSSHCSNFKAGSVVVRPCLTVDRYHYRFTNKLHLHSQEFQVSPLHSSGSVDHWLVRLRYRYWFVVIHLPPQCLHPGAGKPSLSN